MRTVENVWYRNFLYNIENTKSRYDDAITRTTTGKKLTDFSDNPSDMSYVLNLRNKVEQTSQFLKNIETGKSFLSSTESSLSAIENFMYRVITLAEQGASETNEGPERVIIADEVEAIRTSVLSLSNTEVMGRYLFAGTDCNNIPFEKDPNEAVPDTVLYYGNADEMNIQADFSVQVGVNIPGSEVFGVGAFAPAGSTDIFQRLADLRDALIADDTTAIGNSIGNFNDITKQINQSLGKVGNRIRQLTETTGMLKDFQTSLIQKMSSLEDADMAKAISDLKTEEIGLQATLQTGSRINNISLINFLR